MPKTFAAACLACALALSPLAAVAQTDTSGGAMPDKSMSMAPKKPMAKHHSMHKKPMAKPGMAKSGDMQPKM
ncbi:hypothetical protein DFR50_11574 [Roseiarcus fermentans]|uniref:Pentapeptide MXKDX repeat protein n=1 Tax=Roseiarcus fermentans TaxID=1473586 RepID=A0A366FBI4_9HYPH|nr:hypothetical protein [Roseiarcus fermentans]RBP11967.1 hypothetical protein DFR50_11574 [Roseiarcus fermentans]